MRAQWGRRLSPATRHDGLLYESKRALRIGGQRETRTQHQGHLQGRNIEIGWPRTFGSCATNQGTSRMPRMVKCDGKRGVSVTVTRRYKTAD